MILWRRARVWFIAGALLSAVGRPDLASAMVLAGVASAACGAIAALVRVDQMPPRQSPDWYVRRRGTWRGVLLDIHAGRRRWRIRRNDRMSGRPLWFRFAAFLYFVGMPRAGAKVARFFTSHEIARYRAELEKSDGAR